MAYRVEVGPQADVQLSELDPAVGAAIERKITCWQKTLRS